MVSVSKVSQAIESRGVDGWSDQKIDLTLERFGFHKDAQAASTLIEQHFNGDASDAVEFLAEHGADPRIADMEFGDFVKNAGTYIPEIQREEVTVSVKANDGVVDTAVVEMDVEVEEGGKRIPTANAQTLAAQVLPTASGAQLAAAGFDDKGRMDFLSLVTGKLDANGDGFIGGTRDQLHAEMDDRLLAKYDFNGDGVVGLGIMQSVLHALGDRVFDRVDLNGDDQIGLGILDGILERGFGDGQEVFSVGANLSTQADMPFEPKHLTNPDLEWKPVHEVVKPDAPVADNSMTPKPTFDA